jgi:multidrug efflux pump
MNVSAPFINRPIATTLLAIGIVLSGILSFYLLPVASLPQIEFPAIMIQASLPGASSEVMSASVATPIVKQLTRIAGINEMTANSMLGTSSIAVQFDLSRNIDGAARDVQAAINASMSDLPANMTSNPTYRKINPADYPILILALTSDSYKMSTVYDYASTMLQQEISHIHGVGQVMIGGSSPPAIRIEVNPNILNSYGLALTDITAALRTTNISMAVGEITQDLKHSYITINSQISEVKDYANLIIGYHNGRVVRISDVAKITESMQNVRTYALFNGKPTVAMIIYKEPGANVLETVVRIKNAIPKLKQIIPVGINIDIIIDRTTTIEASLRDVEKTLVLAIILVIIVVYGFLRSVRATIIPAIAMALSLLGTFVVMKLCGFSLNNLSLMALIIATGFVVDDAIVVLENISRYIEIGMKPLEASLKGTEEMGFTVTSMSISLIAVFIPILCMGGIIGRLFQEFAITLSVAILISLLVSLTLTPVMCSRILKPLKAKEYGISIQEYYKLSLEKVISHKKTTLLLVLGAICLNIYLFIIVPKGLFPQQDTGRITGSILTDQNTSFQSLSKQLEICVDIIKNCPEVKNVAAVIGLNNNTTNSGSIFIALQPLGIRTISADEVIKKLRKALSVMSSATIYMQSSQDIILSAKQGNAQFQYTVSANTIQDANHYAPIIMEEFKKISGVIDINSDQKNHGLQSYIKIDYNKAASLGITAQDIDNTLYSAFGQMLSSMIYKDLSQYYVVLEVASEYLQRPESLDLIYVKSSKNDLVPLSSFAHFGKSETLLAVNQEGLAPSATLSFNILPGFALGDIVKSIDKIMHSLSLPLSIQGNFSGTAQAFQASLKNEPYLILFALFAVYIVLGILYESLLHPVTIISTLPSAGVGALIALMLTKTDLSVIAMIGIILLIGLVKKNAIMMIDVVLEIKKAKQISSEKAIIEAATLRFRPIMMTSMTALFTAIPLALGTGDGAEMRQPLGITIIGGLLIGQLITIYTTPVIYLAMENLKSIFKNRVES